MVDIEKKLIGIGSFIFEKTIFRSGQGGFWLFQSLLGFLPFL